jgi:predicted unusual protein kinase regulating ubiquinone biosynthesis (AarF/ABC1/UbiB family)
MTDERATLSGRVKRVARVGAGVGGLAMRYAGKRVMGRESSDADDARALKSALGNLKGPLMKVAQMLATIPEALPEEYARELLELQQRAPAMGFPFVRRRMAAELGPDWQKRFASFEREAAAAASLGQVHRAEDKRGRALALKLQYPDMASAVEADIGQLSLILSLYKRLSPAIDPSEIAAEIAARLREEIDYAREARHIALYAEMLADEPRVTVPKVMRELSTPRLLAMTWLEGTPLLSLREAPQATRNKLAEALFRAWWRPFARYGVIHGDPHPGNYSARADLGINLLDFGCIRVFTPDFVKGVVDLYRALERDDRKLAASAYERWGFAKLDNALVDALNIWARFIYGPLLDNRVRTIADGVRPSDYGRRELVEVHKRLKALGPVKPPREFVFMDRAAIGLGAVFLHLKAALNFKRLFIESIESFSTGALAERQAAALAKAGLSSSD